jgi:hypothetical protein
VDNDVIRDVERDPLPGIPVHADLLGLRRITRRLIRQGGDELVDGRGWGVRSRTARGAGIAIDEELLVRTREGDDACPNRCVEAVGARVHGPMTHRVIPACGNGHRDADHAVGCFPRMPRVRFREDTRHVLRRGGRAGGRSARLSGRHGC